MLLRIAGIAALFVAAGAVADTVKPELEMDAQGTIEIGIDGSVRDYRLDNTLSPQVAAAVDRSVRAWQFRPINIDGQAVIAKTALRLHLKGVPTGADSYTIRIADVIFGAPKAMARMKPPHYPEAAVHAHVGGRVLLSLRLDADGNVIDVLPYQTSLNVRIRSERDAEHWRKLFEQASVTAAKTWRYDLAQTINGKPIGASVLVPLSFSVCDMPCRGPESGTWKSYIPGPVHPAPWADSARIADIRDLSTLKDNEALPLETPFRLKDDVIGKAL